MVGVYFSGTGNTKYCVSKFLEYYNDKKENDLYSIEDKNCITKIKESNDIVFAYPIYYSDIPIIVKDFLNNNKEIFKNKNIFIIITMGLFSGDGTGCSARLLKKYGADIIGGVHIKMPDCIGDVKLLKKDIEGNKKTVEKADIKIRNTVANIKKGKYPKDGLSLISYLLGLFGQRLWFYNKPFKLKDKLKIDYYKCISCGKCSVNCPTKNLRMIDNQPVPQGNCTSCYRCINNCPECAITLIGSKVYQQGSIEKYLVRK